MRALLLLALLSLCSAAAAETIVRHPGALDGRDQRDGYFIALLELALEQTRRDHGDWRLQAHSDAPTQSRAIEELAAGKGLDVLWTMTSRERERKLRPVRIPLLRGLMGWRILIIRETDQAWFREVRSLEQLRQLRAGQGHDWPDTDILEANGLRPQRVRGYDNLFQMLHRGRFDYLPRALNEPWEEVARRPELALAVEEELLLYYPTANYFFVHPENKALAQRLETGLHRAIDSGAFDKLFHEHPVNHHALERANLGERRILELDNPLLPEETPIGEERFWFHAP